MNSKDHAKIPVRCEGVIWSILHFFIGLNVVIIVVFVFYSGFVEDLGRADVVNREPRRKELVSKVWLSMRHSSRLFCKFATQLALTH